MNRCEWCLEENQSVRCARCKSVYYCDQECQKKHWILHKQQCNKEEGKKIITRMHQVNHIVKTTWLCVKKMNEGNESEELTDRLMHLLTREKPMKLFWSDFICCAPSSIHGTGVFVRDRAIPSESVLTLYPVDIIVRREKELLLFGDDDDTPEKHWSEEKLMPLCDSYAYCMRKDLKIVGLPSKIDNPCLLAHMLNDACQKDFFSSLPLEELKNLEVMESVLISFFTASKKYINCRFKSDENSLLLTIISLRELLPGEELFVCYGLEYWLANNYGMKPFDTYPWLLENMKKIFAKKSFIKGGCT